MISRVFSPEIETREQGTFRYLILYRKSVEGGGGQEPVLITDISPRAPPPCPFHLREPPSTLVVHFTSSSSLFPVLPIPLFLSSLLSLNTHTHKYMHAHILTSFYLGPRNGDKSGFSPGTLPCLYAVAVSAEGIGTRGLMFRN